MKTFDKYRISSASMRHVYGGLLEQGPVIEPTAEICAISCCDLCYSARYNRKYCCNCRPNC
jgi:hypothetical protein